MGFSIGTLVSDLTNPGKLISDLAGSALPSNMKGIGDMLGGIADLGAGNPLGALSHLTDALKDLPQLLQSLAGGAAGASKPAGTAAAEPTPPPTRATASSAPAATTASTPATTTATSTPATTTTASAPAATAAASTPPTTTAASAPAPTTPASPTPAPAATPSTAAASPTSTTLPSPTVTVTKHGRETITRIDDGNRTTTVAEVNGHTVVGVRDDATGRVLSRVSGSGNLSLGVNGATISVTHNGSETLTKIDDGNKKTTIDQIGGRTTVSIQGAAPVGGAAPAAASVAAPSTPAAAAPPAPTGASSTTASAGASAASPATGASTATGTTTAAGASTTNATGASGSSSSASGSSSASPKDLASLMALSPDQFMQAVTSGKIPPDVANSQSAMMQVQARMNQITQMNQLVTGMMAAMHQMQMAIIQNIRC
jgi:hypothetical protein